MRGDDKLGLTPSGLVRLQEASGLVGRVVSDWPLLELTGHERTGGSELTEKPLQLSRGLAMGGGERKIGEGNQSTTLSRFGEGRGQGLKVLGNQPVFQKPGLGQKWREQQGSMLAGRETEANLLP